MTKFLFSCIIYSQNRGIPRKYERCSMIISFVGHSFIGSSDKVKEIVKDKIKNNIVDVKKVECYLGGYGDFDEICLRACRELKKENPNIEVIYITPYISLSWRSKIEKNIVLL